MNCYSKQQEVLTYGKQPWFEYNNLEVIQNVTRGRQLSPPDNCPPALVELMQACWQFNPSDRIPISKVHVRLKHLMEQHRNGQLQLADCNATHSGGSSSSSSPPIGKVQPDPSRELNVPRKKASSKESSSTTVSPVPVDPEAGVSSPEPVSTNSGTGTDTGEPSTYLELRH